MVWVRKMTNKFWLDIWKMWSAQRVNRNKKHYLVDKTREDLPTIHLWPPWSEMTGSSLTLKQKYVNFVCVTITTVNGGTSGVFWGDKLLLFVDSEEYYCVYHHHIGLGKSGVFWGDWEEIDQFVPSHSHLVPALTWNSIFKMRFSLNSWILFAVTQP